MKSLTLPYSNDLSPPELLATIPPTLAKSLEAG